MALFDVMFEFDDALDLGTHTNAEVEASTNVLDFVDSDLEMGQGEPLWLNIQVAEAFTSGGSSTLVVDLMRETDTDIDASSTTIYETGAIDIAALTLGAWILRMPLPVNVDEDRYIGLLYTIGATTLTAGKVNAWLDHGPQSSYDTQVTGSNIS